MKIKTLTSCLSNSGMLFCRKVNHTPQFGDVVCTNYAQYFYKMYGHQDLGRSSYKRMTDYQYFILLDSYLYRQHNPMWLVIQNTVKNRKLLQSYVAETGKYTFDVTSYDWFVNKGVKLIGMSSSYGLGLYNVGTKTFKNGFS